MTAMDERELLARLAAGPVSGSRLAAELGLTRAAVWKRVQALREAGVAVAACAGVGYALERPLDLLDVQAILAQLPPATAACLDLELAWALDSTNDALLRRPPPEAGVSALLAERQRAGRGRHGRVWTSPLAANLYLSLSRRFHGGLARLAGLSLAAGVVVVEALHDLGLRQVGLKWPNDIIVERCKLGGVLVEGGGEAAGDARAVVGVGLNVRMPASAAGAIEQPWVDLQRLLEPTPARNTVAAALLRRLVPALERFQRDGLSPFLDACRRYDSLCGHDITLLLADGRRRHGQAAGIDDDGALRVQTDAGLCRFHSGEVSVRER